MQPRGLILRKMPDGDGRPIRGSALTRNAAVKERKGRLTVVGYAMRVACSFGCWSKRRKSRIGTPSLKGSACLETRCERNGFRLLHEPCADPRPRHGTQAGAAPGHADLQTTDFREPGVARASGAGIVPPRSHPRRVASTRLRGRTPTPLVRERASRPLACRWREGLFVG